MLDMPVEDAELVVEALCSDGQVCFKEGDEDIAMSLYVIASYIEVQINAAKNLAAKRDADPQAGGYMQFDVSQDAAAHYQAQK